MYLRSIKVKSDDTTDSIIAKIEKCFKYRLTVNCYDDFMIKITINSLDFKINYIIKNAFKNVFIECTTDVLLHEHFKIWFHLKLEKFLKNKEYSDYKELLSKFLRINKKAIELKKEEYKIISLFERKNKIKELYKQNSSL